MCLHEANTDGWNEVKDNYAFVYSIPNDASKKVLVKCLAMNQNNQLLIDALASGSSDPVHLEINIDDFAVESDDKKYRSQYKNLGELVDSINKGVLANVFGYFTASAINAKRAAEMREAELIEKSKSAVFQQSESLEGIKIEGYDFGKGLNVSQILKSLGPTGIQASNLGDAIEIVKQMIEWRLSHEQATKDCSEEEKSPTYRESVKCKIFLGFTSNIFSPGVRDNIRHLVKHNLVDVLMTTSGGIEEEILKYLADKSKGDLHTKGDDKLEDWIVPILDKMLEEQITEHLSWTPSRVIARLGKEINNESSFLYWAYKNNIPVYCPAFFCTALNGPLRKTLHSYSIRNPSLLVDSMQEHTMLHNESLHSNPRKTAMIILGGDENMMCNGADFKVIINTLEKFNWRDSSARSDACASDKFVKKDPCFFKVLESIKYTCTLINVVIIYIGCFDQVHYDATVPFPLLVRETFGKIKGYEYNQGLSLSQILNPAPSTGFLVSYLGEAIDIVNQMLEWRLSHDQVAEDCSEEEKNPTYRESVRCKIFLGFTSNIISSGVRDIIRYLAEHRMVDVIVTTTGGIEEDLIKCFANTYRGDFSLPGADLRSKGLNRIGNMVIPNDNYCKFQNWVLPILDQMLEEQKKMFEEQQKLFEDKKQFDTQHVFWTPSKVIERLGKEIKNESSYLYWASKNKIPVYCPGLTDGSLGDMLYYHPFHYRNRQESQDPGSKDGPLKNVLSHYPGLVADVEQDIMAMNGEAVHATPRKTGMIILGGGLPKHHICNANLMRNGVDYAVFINTAQEFDASDSGAHPDEAVSWGKISASAKSVKLSTWILLIVMLLISQNNCNAFSFGKYCNLLCRFRVQCEASIAFLVLVAETFAAKREKEKEMVAAKRKKRLLERKEETNDSKRSCK
ncbi:uncharacterized protein LOC143555221 [Bidens hawaiensis]|uniref:uncharacterized protein LOC143555221 n=1 Tax=Bidens hawaiensis TaxID=980011 RepID=UPI00404AF4AA